MMKMARAPGWAVVSMRWKDMPELGEFSYDKRFLAQLEKDKYYGEVEWRRGLDN